jgi:hypothetical protein
MEARQHMTDTVEPLTKQAVIRAVAELRKGRSRSRANLYMRSVLRQHGDGARNIHELDPKYYRAVFDAVGGTIPHEDFFGVPEDALPPPPAKVRVTNDRPTLRLKSPLTLDLERRLAERAGKPRSKPTLRVNVGAPAQFGDDAPQRDYPNDGRKMS